MSNFLQRTPTEFFVLVGIVVLILAIGITLALRAFLFNGEATILAAAMPVEANPETKSSTTESTRTSTKLLLEVVESEPSLASAPSSDFNLATTSDFNLATTSSNSESTQNSTPLSEKSNSANESANTEKASRNPLVNPFGELGIGDVYTEVVIDPSKGTVGTAVDVVIIVSNSFGDSRIRDIRVEAIKDGSLEFFPDTFAPTPEMSPITTEAVPSLVWSGLELAPSTELVIKGRGRITGPRSFKIMANSIGKREVSVGSDGEVQGSGSGRGVTSSIRDDQDALVVGESFQYLVQIEGQADTPEPFEVRVHLPEQVVVEDIQVTSKEALAVGVCQIDAAELSIICSESKVKKGGTMTITAQVRATLAGPSTSANAAKARLVVNYPETGLEVSSEEVTFIYQ